MSIKINTQKTYIPIELGDIELRFDVSDDSVIEFRKKAKEVQESLEKVSVSEDYEKAMKQTQGALKSALDTFFGDGSYDKVYELSPSVRVVLSYFQQMTEAIQSELKTLGYSESQQEKVQKYLNKK